jgi:hypothetical protein
VDVNAAIHAESAKFTGQSKVEYDAALPHLIGLLEQNQSEEATSGNGPDAFLVSVSANGSASWRDGKKISGQLYAEIKRLAGRHV